MEEVVVDYEKNLKLLAERYPEMASEVAALTYMTWRPVYRGKDHEPDLFKENYYLHEQQVEGSIRYWLSQISLNDLHGLVVYGLGLGHIWDYLKQWLHSQRERRLIIFEDDPEIVRYFLTLPRAEGFLKDPQVVLMPLGEKIDQTLLWKMAESQLFQKIEVTALPSYLTRKARQFQELKFILDYARYVLNVRYGEYFDSYRHFFENFWANLPQLPHSYLGGALQGRFKGVPAIICGAGPSLAKNISLLPQLKDKALILAGGTAVNVLNGHGIDPHFTLGIDPFPSYYSRTLAYTSFETPFVYKPRVQKDLFDLFSPPLVYLNLGNSYQVEKQVQKDLHIPYLDLELGTNVVHASLRLAHFMGCNPIIAVGVDLAYSGGASYGPGLKRHAATSERLDSKNSWEEVIVRPDIEGKPVETLWKWVHEAMWYAEFQKKHPDFTLLNATEGGIGFLGIPNVKLGEIPLTQSWDLSGWVHAELQQAQMPSEVTSEHIQKEMERFKDSLQAITTELENKKTPTGYDCADMCDLQDEFAWQGLLREFDEFYHFIREKQGEIETDQKDLLLEELKGHISYLKRIAELNMKLIQKVLAERSLSQPILKQEREEREPIGASNFYDGTRRLVASSSFSAGVREGPAKYWYAKGGLFAHLHFSHGQFEGPQRYYYPNGALKSIIPYSQGLLDGEVQLFWPNGQKKRLVHFKLQKRDGPDQIWSEKGALLVEADYVDDRPKGIARRWSPEGHLVAEIVYDEAGNPLHRPQEVAKDYFDFVADKSSKLATSLDGIVSHLKEAADKSDMSDLQKELERLKSLGEELEHLSKTRKQEADTNPEIAKKVKDNVSEMTEKMQGLLQHMDFQIKHLRNQLHPDE